MTAVAAAVDTGSRPNNVLNCWRCRKEGHISRDCPVQRSTLKCFSCRGEGHFSRQCSERRTTNLVASRSDSGAHPYDKCGEINGMSNKVLIDTGSHYSLIKKTVAEKCGLPITYVANRLFGLGDVNVPSVVTIGEINSTIIVDEVDAGPVKLLVLPDTVQKPDVIVERNW